jgi:hypothetical protein
MVKVLVFECKLIGYEKYMYFTIKNKLLKAVHTEYVYLWGLIERI